MRILWKQKTHIQSEKSCGSRRCNLFYCASISSQHLLKAIVGVPVGFVGAADSKEALRNSDIPNIIVEGPKGGTPIAVACVNSLIQHL